MAWGPGRTVRASKDNFVPVSYQTQRSVVKLQEFSSVVSAAKGAKGSRFPTFTSRRREKVAVEISWDPSISRATSFGTISGQIR
jgi:hypothetical protein